MDLISVTWLYPTTLMLSTINLDADNDTEIVIRSSPEIWGYSAI